MTGANPDTEAEINERRRERMAQRQAARPPRLSRAA